MLKILIKNLHPSIKVNQNYLKKMAKIVLSALNIEEKELSIVLVDKKFMTGLNKKYRNENLPTDVLAFPNDGVLLGDVVISLDACLSQSRQYHHSFEQELAILLVHGILHLLGFEDKEKNKQKEMRKREKKILEEIQNELCLRS